LHSIKTCYIFVVSKLSIINYTSKFNIMSYQIYGNTIVTLADAQYTVLAMVIACKNEYAGKYTAINCIGLSQDEICKAISIAENAPTTKFKSYLFAQKYAEMLVQNMLNNELCALEAFADAANAILHTAIAVEADLQNKANEVADIFAELDLVPENACEDIALEALIAGSAFDNAEPTPAFSLHYEMPTNLYDLDELSNVIAEEEWRALGTVDAEISALKAKLIQLNDKRIGIVEECAHWRGKCDRAIEIAEYEASYEANEADADLRQSIWLSTGQDIM